jgi:hypothetical protein
MKWIESFKKKPAPCTPVLIAVKGHFEYYVLRAIWIPKFYMEDQWDDFIGKNDYCEEKDMYYFPQGWYEYSNSDEMLWQIKDPVMCWMTMPELPKF